MMQDVGRFDHLDHERALTCANVVLSTDAGKDAIDDANGRFVGRHE